MRYRISQFSCLCQILKCTFVLSFIVARSTHMAHCSWIICLYSFHIFLLIFFLVCSRLSTEWATKSLLLVMFVGHKMGMNTSLANCVAAACIKPRFQWINRQRQEAERTLPKMCLVGLCK